MEDFYFVRNLESIAGVRYLAVNAELEGEGANICFGPPVIDGRVRLDSPMVGLYARREILGVPNLADALAEVQDHNLNKLSLQCAEDEGRHHR